MPEATSWSRESPTQGPHAAFQHTLNRRLNRQIQRQSQRHITPAGITLHQVLVRGKNTHHIIESTFKSTARALRDAVRDAACP